MTFLAGFLCSTFLSKEHSIILVSGYHKQQAEMYRSIFDDRNNIHEI